MSLARSTLLSAASVIVALGLASAQAGSSDKAAPSRPPTAAPQASGESGAGGMPSKPEDMGGGKTSPGKSSMSKDAKPGAGPEAGKPDAKGAASDSMSSSKDSSKGQKPEADAKGAAAEKETKSKAAEGESKTDSKTNAATKSMEGAVDEKTGAAAKTSTEAPGEGRPTAKGTTDAEVGATAPKAGKSVRLETQQVTKVKTYFTENRPTVKAIDKNEVSVSIGIALLGTIVLYDLPPDIIVVEGACPIKYFVWGDDIVLVDSCTREVVEIIVGVA